MDQLFPKVKLIHPEDPDEEINQGISLLREKYPDATDDDLLVKVQQTAPSTVALNNPVSDPVSKTQEGIVASYSPEARAVAEKKASDVNNSTRNKIGNALTVFAEGFKKSPDFAGAMQENRAHAKDVQDKYVGAFDKAKENAVQDYNIGRTVKQDERADTKFTQEQGLSNANRDKNSAISTSKRLNAMKLDPTNKDKYKDMSGEEIDQIQKNLETNYKIDQDNQTRRDKIASDATARATAKAEKGEKAKSDKELSAFRSLQGQLSGARQDPATRQAELDIYNANKVDDLVNLYGDPNKLSPGQVAIATSEIAKIAKGGVPDSQEWKAIDPSTFKGALAKSWQKVTNEPSEANAGAFLKQYSDYAGALRKNAEKTIENSYGRKIESWKQRLDPDDYQSLQDEYINRFKKYPSNNKGVSTKKTATDINNMSEDELDKYIAEHQ